MNRKLSLIVVGIAVAIMTVVGVFRAARMYKKNVYVAAVLVHTFLPHLPSPQTIFDDYRDKDEEEAQTERIMIVSYAISGNRPVS